jgi:fructosamine-3-kinase
MFAAEASGLAALRSTHTLRIPEPIAWCDSRDGASWLLMEHIAPAAPRPTSDERLGRGLAALHSSGAPPPAAGDGPPIARDAFGWRNDNWIGSLDQRNAPTSSWASFWRDRRIAPQVAEARAHGHATEEVFDRLIEAIPSALVDVSRPELLHGDLWSGNTYTTTGGEPVVVDPAVYLGDGEVDLAMTELFARFGSRFYDAYQEARGISTGYSSYRRDLYQLYYLLVHVNLFGASYMIGSIGAAERVVAEIG